MMMKKLLVIFLAFITTIIFFQLNTGRTYAQETCTGTTCAGLCYDPTSACSSGFFRCASNIAQCCVNSCGPTSDPDSCHGGCPSGYNFLCSGADTGYVTGCCPQGQFCPLVDGEYVQPSNCPSEYPKYCSSTNSCISNDWDCNNYVQNCGGYDYWFCPTGATATCSNNTPVCAPPGFDPGTATSCGGEIFFCPAGFNVSCFNNIFACTSIQNPSLFTQFPAPLTGETIDQIFAPNDIIMSNTDPGNYLISPNILQNSYEYQTFTAGISGNLSRVAIKVFKLADVASGNIKLAITGVVDGHPDNTLLSDEVIISTSDLVVSTSPGYPNNPNDVIAQFNTKPQLVPGQIYAIRIGYSGDTASQTILSLSSVRTTNPSNGYAGGLLCDGDLSGSSSCNDLVDITFSTYIVRVGSAGSTPAPTTAPAPTSAPIPAPTSGPTPTSVIGPCGISNIQINEGLITSPFLDGQSGQTGGGSSATTKCIINTKAQFAPFDIPTFDDLKSLYYDQKKYTKHELVGDKTQTEIPFNDTTDSIYHISGNLTISGNNGPNPPTHSGVVFVDGNLNITQDYTYGSALTGSVFVVKGDVNIHKDVERIDAVIISNGTICTAFDAGICPGDNIVTQPLTINGSLISIKQPDPTEINPQESIRFRRSLSDNTQAAEIINHQVKYLVILRNLFSDTWQKWSEIP